MRRRSRKSPTPGFYAYDAGKRFTAGKLVAVVRGAHAQGVKLQWHLGAIDAHVGCDMAWAAWENRGSVGVPPQITPLSWLENPQRSDEPVRGGGSISSTRLG